MNRYFRVFAAAMVAAMICGCTGSSRHAAPERVEILRLDRLVSAHNAAPADSVAAMRTGLDALALVYGMDPDSLLAHGSELPAVAAFQPRVESCLGNLQDIELALGSVKINMHRVLPAVHWPQIYGMVTPYYQSVVTVDTVMLVGLNHYLGADFDGYDGMEDYRRRLKEPERLAVDVAEALVRTAYPYQSNAGDTPTLLSRMLYEGAVAQVLTRLFPNANAAATLGYTPEQWRWLEDNEKQIWEDMVRGKYLYDTDPAGARRWLNQGPFTAALGPESAPRAGVYLGYKIVNAYLKANGGVALEELLSPDFYDSDTSLAKARYQGN